MKSIQVNEIEDDVQYGDLGMVHVVEVLLCKVGERRVPMIPPIGPTASDSSMNLTIPSLFRASTERAFKSPPSLLSPRQPVTDPFDYNKKVDVAGSVIGHPGSDSDSELNASINQQVDLAGVK